MNQLSSSLLSLEEMIVALLLRTEFDFIVFFDSSFYCLRSSSLEASMTDCSVALICSYLICPGESFIKSVRMAAGAASLSEEVSTISLYLETSKCASFSDFGDMILAPCVASSESLSSRSLTPIEVRISSKSRPVLVGSFPLSKRGGAYFAIFKISSYALSSFGFLTSYCCNCFWRTLWESF